MMAEKHSFEEEFVNGALAGLLATFPMTVAMFLLQRAMPIVRHKSLAPKKVTMRIAKKVGLPRRLRRKQRHFLTTVSHFGYGAAAGAVYAPLSVKMPSSPVVKGTLYGIAVWAGSYRGWLPTFNIWNPKIESPMRSIVMILAHVVWGASTAVLVDRLEHKP